MLPDIRDHIDPELSTFFGIEALPPIQGRVLVITGENASGKSLFRRAYTFYISKITHSDENIEIIPLSMEARAAGGIRRLFLYGGSLVEIIGICHLRKGVIKFHPRVLSLSSRSFHFSSSHI